MTQDQCCDNGHQARSNNHSSNDQVSDDLNNSKNSIASNGVDSMQKFNVDVNSKRSEHGVDVVIVQDRSVDADHPPAVKVLTTNKHTAPSSSSSSDLVDSKEISNSLRVAFDVNRSAGSNDILADMTVISHQNSSENIREIISKSDQNNKVQSDSEIVGVINKANGRKKPVQRQSVIKSDDKPEDPIERLNKLRASISNALSEVKGVLKQYSTEQNGDGENESALSGKPTDDGPVRFRFVRKIRRKSVFSEDDDNGVLQNGESKQKIKTETTPTERPNEVNKVAENLSDDANKTSVDSKCVKDQEAGSGGNQMITPDAVDSIPNVELVASCKGNHDEKEDQSDKSNVQSNDNFVQIVDSQEMKMPEKEVQQKEHKESRPREDAIVSGPVVENNPTTYVNQTKLTKKTNKAKALDEFKQTETSNIVNKPTKRNSIKLNSSDQSGIASGDTKKLKLKKVVKKDRRASIAALEANQTSTDNSTTHLNLKTQRRPSDSGTVVKQPVQIKSKSQSKVKTTAVTTTDTSDVTGADFGPSHLVSMKENAPLSKINQEPEILISEKDTFNAKTEDLLINESKNAPGEMTQPSIEELNTNNIDETNKINTQQQLQIPVEDSKVSAEHIVQSMKPESNILSKLDSPVTSTDSFAVEFIENNQTVANAPTLDPIVADNDLVGQCKDSEETCVNLINETLVQNLTETNEGFDPESAKVPISSSVVNVTKASSSVTGSCINVELDSIKTDNVGTEETGPVALQEMVSEKDDTQTDPTQTKAEVPVPAPKKKKKAKRKVVIRRLKRKLSKEDTFIQAPEAAAELEICEKEIEEKDEEQEPEEIVVPKQRKPCIKARQFEIGDVVMYAERYKKTQVKWRKGIVIERITSISYKLNLDGEEKPAHISYIKKFTDRKVMFGGKEYLEIDYAQIEEDEEQERNYSIWNLV